MNISFENPDKVSGLLTLVVEEADIKKDVNKTIEDYRKKANIPGFRPGSQVRWRSSPLHTSGFGCCWKRYWSWRYPIWS